MTFGLEIFCVFRGRRLFACDMEKMELRSVMTILTDSFVPLHALFWLILNNELWNKFLLGHVGIVREVLQKLVRSSGVSILCTIWQTPFLYAEMHKILIAQKSYCTCHVLRIAIITSKYYFNFILNRTMSGRELFDHPSYTPIDCICLYLRCLNVQSRFMRGVIPW